MITVFISRIDQNCAVKDILLIISGTEHMIYVGYKICFYGNYSQFTVYNRSYMSRGHFDL